MPEPVLCPLRFARPVPRLPRRVPVAHGQSGPILRNAKVINGKAADVFDRGFRWIVKKGRLAFRFRGSQPFGGFGGQLDRTQQKGGQQACVVAGGLGLRRALTLGLLGCGWDIGGGAVLRGLRLCLPLGRRFGRCLMVVAGMAVLVTVPLTAVAAATVAASASR